jgi:signal transduction histidine kinase
VEDTGCGIPSDQIDRVFNEFSKIPSAIPTSQGAQLGLFITKSFIEMHKGRIWVESQLGTGSRFFFTMPVASEGQAGHTSPQIVSPTSGTKTS